MSFSPRKAVSRQAVSQGAVLALAAVTALGAAVCGGRPESVAPVTAPALPVVSSVAEDTTHKEELRLVPVESYVRTYLSLFGGLGPLEVQQRARGADGPLLFDAWDDYLTALGMPDHRIDLPRGGQTNAIMLAAFERLGAALCDRALEHDWRSVPPVVVEQRLIFAFEVSGPSTTKERFAGGFDVLHRTFLGYPADLAPTDRLARYHRLFEDTVARHSQKDAPTSRLSPVEAGWVAVCEGLVRHPEFHLY